MVRVHHSVSEERERRTAGAASGTRRERRSELRFSLSEGDRRNKRERREKRELLAGREGGVVTLVLFGAGAKPSDPAVGEGTGGAAAASPLSGAHAACPPRPASTVSAVITLSPELLSLSCLL